MKIIKLAFIALIYSSIISCNRDIEISPGLEEFEVSTDKTIYKVNEEVKFNLKGNPDIISFYSGELYSQYEYKEAREIILDKAILSFSSTYPDATSTTVLQNPDFKVLVSTDFNNVYNYESLNAANWIDITSRFNIQTSGIAAVAAGSYQISDLAVPGKPLYIAFKYASKKQEEFGKIRRRTITLFNVTGTSIFGDHLLGNPSSSNFRLIEKSEDSKTLSSITSTTLTFNGYSRSLPTDPDPETDTWIVSKAFDLGVLDNGPDRPIAIKGNVDPALTTHYHAFTKAGEYIVTFVGINANVSGRKEIVRQVKITVE
ncbi:hypothetical protein Pedsa_0693 [Pseudopedobacter saltans DSM 12145]|uniref:DUF5017 domain-containing protein n=1 Tax=Pseudopedobacter saltans (strain ATCC 51119 / DSM 12145 / JCM 21818 / CCUG 39354 / LMG 10337 / NBRC 100064 / NCIMB 13643) TaxID=762903 RepID=F0S8I5_PSESL|nr:DUF5017 domain-containing protein [Pseudopedobacter saltans]ADY51269.1 hypothetical protein Pedsa_0693 [Pseudopedobacter saltans DSM 12145]